LSLKVENWFPTPVWYVEIPNITKEDEDQAIKYCKKLKLNSIGRVLSNVGGWQSKDMTQNDLINTPLFKYFEYVYNVAGECLKQLDISNRYYIDNTWVNINKQGDCNNLHTHPRALLSGVFYLSDNNSNLVFVRPQNIDTYSLEIHNSKNNTYHSYNRVTYTPKARILYLFPSWLPHMVEKNDVQSERISVAFNVNILND